MKHSDPSFKRLVLTFLLLYALIALVPLAVSRAQPMPVKGGSSLLEAASRREPSLSSSGPPEVRFPDASPQNSPQAQGVFTLRDAATGETFTVPEREFVEASLACEMDLSSPAEALKAQAVAAYTYYSRQRAQGQTIACDTANWLVYVPESAMRERWGEDYEEYRAAIRAAVDAVEGQLLTYQDKPILAAYFAISTGGTEAVENVWSPDAAAEHPYLQAVASPGDAFSDGYLSRVQLTDQQFQEAVAAHFTDNPPDLSGPPENWLTEIEYTPSRMVKTAKLGGRSVTGPELRAALGLRSAGFTFTREEGVFDFTVRGWGHGVGMSQAGAVFLAKRGADYQEILAHYYPGTELAVE